MLYGFGISGFRSFGPTPQLMAPLGKINVFVGQNNTGKSNILKALRILVRAARTRGSESFSFDPIVDAHKGVRQAQLMVHLAVPTDQEKLTDFLLRVVPQGQDNTRQLMDIASNILTKLPTNLPGAAWFSMRLPERSIEAPVRGSLLQTQDQGGRLTSGVPDAQWTGLWSALRNMSGGGHAQHIDEVLASLSPFGRTPLADVHFVEPNRQIGPSGSGYEGLNGQGLITRLAELERPSYANQAERQKFDRINDFVRTVTGCSDATLQTSHGANELLVTMEGKLLPIHSVGTGIHEVIIFAAAATAFDEVSLCFEEPEVHLHPRLQRRLLAYLRDHTSNQYFITSHSAHLLDAEYVTAFHVQQNTEGETTVSHINTPSRRASVCFDLGYRPSDFVQANCIVWVEGPSDRVYVNAWIQAVASDLIEGDHYSVMFYGGKLLSHLEVSDEAVSEFIELQRLNRRVAILMDSDKSASTEVVRETKARVADETNKHHGFVWITECREVENYVPQAQMAAALASLYPEGQFVAPHDEWQCAYERRTGDSRKLDKLRLARCVVQAVDLSVLDLRVRVESLVEFIRQSNA